MPTKRRRQARHAQRPVVPAVRFFLALGQWPDRKAHPEHREGILERWTRRDHLREDWVLVRDELLGEAAPGTRPGGWWKYEAPEPRRQVGDAIESQAAYLDRLGLLTDQERRRLSAVAFEPERTEHGDWADTNRGKKTDGPA
jgi:hypothetical protein